jgi:hypothetical protein
VATGYYNIYSEDVTFIFIYGSFSDVSTADYIGQMMGLINDELERTWKHAVAAYFNVLQRIRLMKRRKARKTCRASQWLGLDSNRASSEYKSRARG